jgi:hypothetical protein
MRHKRELAENVWYGVETAINIGGNAFFQYGSFFAAAPWRSVQATPQAQQKVAPVSGDVMGGSEDMARKEIAEFIACKLSWGCSRGAGRGKKAGDSPKCAFSVSSGRDKERKPAPSAEKTAL